MLQSGIFRAGRMPVDRAPRGNGKASSKPKGAESQLQLLGGCPAARRTHEVTKADHHWFSIEKHEASDPATSTNARCGNA